MSKLDKLVILLLSLFLGDFPFFAYSSAVPYSAIENTLNKEGVRKTPGICKIMLPPGRDANLYTPCRKEPLQLIYKKGNQQIISIIRTGEDGKFEIQIPSPKGWAIASGSLKWSAELEIGRDSSGAASLIVVVLKPIKTL